MPNKLERTLARCSVDMVRQGFRSLIRSGLSEEEVADIFDEIEGWLAWEEHPSPDVFEGPQGWYRVFSGGGFVLEGEAGKTCPSRVLRPKPEAVDLDNPDTWKKRPTPKFSAVSTKDIAAAVWGDDEEV